MQLVTRHFLLCSLRVLCPLYTLPTTQLVINLFLLLAALLMWLLETRSEAYRRTALHVLRYASLLLHHTVNPPPPHAIISSTPTPPPSSHPTHPMPS